jgi:hypothetical protein
MSLYLNDDAFQITFETLWIINSFLMERKKIEIEEILLF